MLFDPRAYEIGPAIQHWLIVFAGCLGVAVVVGILVSLATQGITGPASVIRQILEGIRDILQVSARRVWAMAMLTIREAIRRKAPLVLLVFALLFMFAGWFLPQSEDRPELLVNQHLSFVFKTITWLILPVALLLACWGIPDDIQARTLHTVVTKPARRLEVVLGRFLGYVVVGSLVLGCMSVVGYIWVNRQISDSAKQHLTCRVPVYGSLRFTDRLGNPSEKGLNVGDVWEFRGYVEGATESSAIFEFEGIGPEHLIDDQLRLESRFESFRTRKGDIVTKLLCQYELINPTTGLKLTRPAFEVNEFTRNIALIDRKLVDVDEAGNETTYDLIDDFVYDSEPEKDADGQTTAVAKKSVLQLKVRCIDFAQYLGMARPDLFIRMPDRSFATGFFKTIFGIWLMMVLVIVLGVTASCFTKGPIAALLTFTLLIVGQGFRDFMAQIVSGQAEVGGPIVALWGIIMHKNPGVAPEPGPITTIVQTIDSGIVGTLWLVQQVIPDFRSFSRLTQYVPKGFDVDWNTALLPGVFVTLAYVFPCLLLGYYCLKLRELESK